MEVDKKVALWHPSEARQFGQNCSRWYTIQRGHRVRLWTQGFQKCDWYLHECSDNTTTRFKVQTTGCVHGFIFGLRPLSSLNLVLLSQFSYGQRGLYVNPLSHPQTHSVHAVAMRSWTNHLSQSFLSIRQMGNNADSFNLAFSLARPYDYWMGVKSFGGDVHGSQATFPRDFNASDSMRLTSVILSCLSQQLLCGFSILTTFNWV